MESFLQKFIDDDPKTVREVYHNSACDWIRKDVRNKGGTAWDAEDVVVLAIIKAQKLIRLGKYKEEGKFYGFLRSVGNWVRLEEWKRKKKDLSSELEVNLEEELISILEAKGPLASLPEEMENIADQVEMNNYIKSLDKRGQEMIRLRYFEGYSLVEIGEKLGINQPNVAHHRYMKKLRKMINSKKSTDTHWVADRKYLKGKTD